MQQHLSPVVARTGHVDAVASFLLLGAERTMQARELAGRAPDYDARIEQGISLLARAKTAPPDETAQMQIQALEILKSVDPEATKLLAH